MNAANMIAESGLTRLARLPGLEGRADSLRFAMARRASRVSLTPCFSWGLGDVLARQPFQRLSADGKPLEAVARIRPASPRLLKEGVHESAVSNAHQTS